MYVDVYEYSNRVVSFNLYMPNPLSRCCNFWLSGSSSKWRCCNFHSETMIYLLLESYLEIIILYVDVDI